MNFRFPGSIFLLLLLSGCASSSLLTQSHNVPLFTEKKEVQYSLLLNPRCGEIHFACSPKEHIGIIANVLAANMQMADVGVGRYRGIRDRGVFEYFGGFGEGTIDNSGIFVSGFAITYGSPWQSECRYKTYGVKAFAQADLGIVGMDRQIGFSLKTSCWYFPEYYFYGKNYRQNSHHEYQLQTTDSLVYRNTGCFTIEPAVTFKRSFGRFRFMAQLGGNCALNFGDQAHPFRYIHYSMLFGQIYDERFSFCSYFRIGVSFRFVRQES